MQYFCTEHIVFIYAFGFAIAGILVAFALTSKPVMKFLAKARKAMDN